jgi:hypothetical protein
VSLETGENKQSCSKMSAKLFLTVVNGFSMVLAYSSCISLPYEIDNQPLPYFNNLQSR